jgi:hypothetical protein
MPNQPARHQMSVFLMAKCWVRCGARRPSARCSTYRVPQATLRNAVQKLAARRRM